MLYNSKLIFGKLSIYNVDTNPYVQYMRMYKSTKTTTTTTIPSIKMTTTTFVVYLNTKHAAYIIGQPR